MKLGVLMRDTGVNLLQEVPRIFLLFFSQTLCHRCWAMECVRSNLLIVSFADRIHSKMGEGTFGQVLECWDREKREMIAIKIVRGIKKYREAAMIEIEMLQQLAKHDKNGNR